MYKIAGIKKSTYKITSSGFSIASVMMAVGIFSLVMLGLISASQTVINANSISKNYQMAQETSAIASALISDPSYCAIHFNGMNLVDAPVTLNNNVSLKTLNPDGTLSATNILAKDMVLGNLKITKIELSATQKIETHRFLGKISISMEPTNNIGHAMNRSTQLFFQTDTTNKITSCGSVLPAEIESIKGVYSDTCSDFAAKGWASKMSCLQDGRWHTVQSNLGNANADLISAIEFGTDVALVYTNASGAKARVICQTAFILSQKAFCNRASAYSGSTLDTVPSPDEFNDGNINDDEKPHTIWGHASLGGLFRSDGFTRNVSLKPANNNFVYADPKLTISEGFMPTIEWRVRY